MINTPVVPSSRSQFFTDTVTGILIYSVVLGFFNDYTNVIHIDSFSFVFFTAIVMQILTYATFAFKRRVVGWFKGKSGSFWRGVLIFCVWVVMFGSKFVFLAAIEILLGHSVDLAGFIGLMAIILTMMTTKYAFDRISKSLG
jgi:hypothetical protein